MIGLKHIYKYSSIRFRVAMDAFTGKCTVHVHVHVSLHLHVNINVNVNICSLYLHIHARLTYPYIYRLTSVDRLNC